MKMFIVALSLLTSISAVSAAETWTCTSADKRTTVVATLDGNKATSSYNNVEMTGNADYYYTSLVGDAGTRDTYHYELKLMRDDRTVEGTGQAVLLINEWIDCLGTYTDFVAMTCEVK